MEHSVTFCKALVFVPLLQIVDMEHQLRRTGQLKSLADLKEFWGYMLIPRSSTSPPSPKPHPQPHPHPVADDDDEDYSNSWAITALAPHHYRESVGDSTFISRPPHPSFYPTL